MTVRSVDPAEARSVMASPGAIWLDVRTAEERAMASIPGSLHLPLGDLLRVREVVPDTKTPLVVYCAVGERSQYAVAVLERLGYVAAVSLDGGIIRWVEEGSPTVSAETSETSAGHDRYAVQMRLPEIGELGQRRLLSKAVAIVGLGGLGSPAALYLAGAGVGRLGLIDSDVVELSNLHRQILHSSARLNDPKTGSAVEALTSLNSDIELIAVEERLSEGNAQEILRDYDVIVDASDNFSTRYAANEAAFSLGLPLVHAAATGWYGEVAVFVRPGPCYRCFAPSEQPGPDCNVEGVLGTVTGVLGSIQATETLRLLLGKKSPLEGKLLVYDAWEQTTHTMRIAQSAGCPTCGSSQSEDLKAEGF